MTMLTPDSTICKLTEPTAAETAERIHRALKQIRAMLPNGHMLTVEELPEALQTMMQKIGENCYDSGHVDNTRHAHGMPVHHKTAADAAQYFMRLLAKGVGR